MLAGSAIAGSGHHLLLGGGLNPSASLRAGCQEYASAAPSSVGGAIYLTKKTLEVEASSTLEAAENFFVLVEENE